MAKVLVTGANGLVGSHLVAEFIEKGHCVRCLAHRNLDRIDGSGAEVVRGDVTNPETLPAAVKDVDYIFHAAAVLRARKKETYYRVNRDGTRNLVRAAREHNPGLKKFVLISSQAVMGPCDGPEEKENGTICTPLTDYGKSKLTGELELLEHKGDMPALILRPSAVYGPGDRDLFPLFRMASKGLFPVLSVDGECSAQFIYVRDIAGICLLAMEKGKDGVTYFIAEKSHYTYSRMSGIFAEAAGRKLSNIKVTRSFLKTCAVLAELFAGITGKAAVLNRQKAEELCQKYWLGSTGKAENDFGYEFTPFEKGVKLTYEWYRNNKWL